MWVRSPSVRFGFKGFEGVFIVATELSRLVAPKTGESHEQPLVRLSQVSKRYSSGTLALSDVNLEVHEGEFVSLLGPSGCGKSTILRSIAGLQSISSGNIEVLGGDVKSLSERPGDLSFVFQEPTLMPWRTVIANVALPLELMGVSRTERYKKAMEMLEMVGLEEVAHMLPRQLSGGMKMRVSIARSLVSRPKLLLMDEPFGALDEITRQRLQDELLRLWSLFGMTIVFVTHNVFEAVYLSSRIIVMASRPGRIKTEIKIDESYPRSRDVMTTHEFTSTVSRAIRELEEE